jgi:hypothetical protein
MERPFDSSAKVYRCQFPVTRKIKSFHERDCKTGIIAAARKIYVILMVFPAVISRQFKAKDKDT